MSLPSSIEERLRVWAARYPEIEELWAYGSHVRGTANAKSDFDVAVRFRELPQQWELMVTDWRAELRRVVSERIDLQVWPASQATVSRYLQMGPQYRLYRRT